MVSYISMMIVTAFSVTLVWIFTAGSFVFNKHPLSTVPHIHTIQTYSRLHSAVRTLYPFRNSNRIQAEREQTIRTICHHTKYNHLLKTYSEIFAVDNVLSRSECEWIVSEAEAYAKRKGGWHTKRHEFYATTDLELTEIEAVSYFSLNLIYGEIIPLFNDKYHLVSTILGVNEVFIVKYEYAEGKQSALEAHLDGGEFTFIIPLNDNFTGGGTTFLPDKADLLGPEDGEQQQTGLSVVGGRRHFNPPVGQMLMFPGQRKHIGEPVHSGVRYIVVGQLGYGSYYACDNIERQEREEEQRRQEALKAAARGQGGGQMGGEEIRHDDDADDDDDVDDDKV